MLQYLNFLPKDVAILKAKSKLILHMSRQYSFPNFHLSLFAGFTKHPNNALVVTNSLKMSN